MSLALGELVGRVVIESAAAESKIGRLMKLFRDLGGNAESAATGTATLDGELVGVATAATKAAEGLDRTSTAARTAAASEDEAAAAATAQARAVARLSGVMEPLVGLTDREQQAQLRLVAAQERLNTLQTSGTATTRQLANAQATLIGAQRSVTAAQDAAAASGSRWRNALGGVTKTAAGLGVIVGVLATAKAAIDITHEANDFQRSMVQIQTNADVTAREVNRASGALLDMAGPVAAAPDKLAVAFYHAKSVGLDYAHAIDTTRIAAEGAKVGHADLEETMNALTSTVASNIPGVKNMSSAMGQLIAIVGSGDMKLADLNQALGSGILTVVKGYGLSLTDVGAALATFGDNNIRGADAATMLRMAVQAMAVPAKAGRDRLEELGLTTDQLAKDMQTGGLNKAILDLKAHLDRAGVSSVQVGAILTEIFGKRAGPGIAVLVGQVDRLQSKFAVLRDSGATFGEKWKATTQTASFALSALRAKAEATGITLTEKLGPSIADAANWLGTTLPHAAHTLIDVFGPLAHVIAVGLVGGFHAFIAVSHAVEATLGTLGHLAEENKGTVTDLAEAALALWVAFRGYSIAVAAFEAIQGAIVMTRVRLLELRESGALAAGGLGLVTVGVYAAGKGINSWVEHGNTMAHVLDNLTNVQKNFRAALDASNGALNTQVSSAVASELQADGLAKKFSAAHVSLADLTRAVTGGDGAFDSFARRIQATGKVSDNTIVALGLIHGEYVQTAAGAKQLAGATKDLGDASGHLAPKTVELTQHQKDLNQANKEIQVVMNGITYAMQGQTTAADRLSNALDTLSGKTLDAMQAELQLKDAAASGPAGSTPSGPAPGTLTSAEGSSASATNRHARAVEALAIAQTAYNKAVAGGDADKIAAAHLRLARAQDAVAASSNAMTSASQRLSGAQEKVAAANKTASSSLSENTAAGRTNIEWLLGMITTANQHANAVMKQTNSIDQSVAALKNDEATIRSAAAAHGIYGKALDSLLAKTEAKPGDLLRLLKSQADTAGTHALSLQKKLDNLTKQKVALIKLKDDGAPVLNQLKAVQDALNKLNGQKATVLVAVVSATTAANLASTYASQVPLFHRAGGGPINGPGPKGVDSVYGMEAPGEYVESAKAVDKYGPAFMAAVNAGTYRPSIQLPAVAPAPMASRSAAPSPSLHAGNIAEALHGMRLVIDAGSVGTLTGFVDSRVGGTLGRASRTPAARQSRVDSFGRT